LAVPVLKLSLTLKNCGIISIVQVGFCFCGNFADNLERNINTCIKLNNEQEELKARLKTKTEELNKQMAELQKKTTEARQIVKSDMPQTTWKEFGILDKR
jgi:hypothetical protein